MVSTIGAVDQLLSGQLGAYDEQMQQAKEARNRQEQVMSENRGRAMQEAYILNRQLGNRLPQQLATQGMHGGLTETSTVDLANQYQNARNTAGQNYQNNLANVDLELFNTESNIRAQIAKAKAEAEAQRIQIAAAEAAAAEARARAARSGSSGLGDSTGVKTTPIIAVSTSPTGIRQPTAYYPFLGAYTRTAGAREKAY